MGYKKKFVMNTLLNRRSFIKTSTLGDLVMNTPELAGIFSIGNKEMLVNLCPDVVFDRGSSQTQIDNYK